MAVKKSIQGGVAVKNLPGAKARSQLMFLDDLNCAGVDDFEIQPPLELLRQILSQGNISCCLFYLVTYFFLVVKYEYAKSLDSLLVESKDVQLLPCPSLLKITFL